MDVMKLRRGMLMAMALQPGWTSVEVSPSSEILKAGDIKTWLETIIGNHKRAVVYLDFDWANSLPTVNRQFVSAELYNGFDTSVYLRYQTANTNFGTYAGVTNTYWTNSYDLVANTTDKYIVFIDTNS